MAKASKKHRVDGETADTRTAVKEEAARSIEEPATQVAQTANEEDSDLSAKAADKDTVPTKLNVRLMAPEITREFFLQKLESDLPGTNVLRGLFDEWRSTGIDPDGQESPFQRDLALTQKARDLCEGFLRRYPPQLALGSGIHYVFLPGVPNGVQLAAWISGDQAGEAVRECAIGDFIYFLGVSWCFEFAKCCECGRYFDMGRAPKKTYPYGIHCSGCQRAQASKAALAATQTARRIKMVERLVLAAQALGKRQEPGIKPDSDWILQAAKADNPRAAKRFGMTANWITRHREEIDEAAALIAKKVEAETRHGSLQAR